MGRIYLLWGGDGDEILSPRYSLVMTLVRSAIYNMYSSNPSTESYGTPNRTGEQAIQSKPMVTFIIHSSRNDLSLSRGQPLIPCEVLRCWTNIS